MVAMTKSAPVPSGYAAALAELKRQVRNARFTAQRRVNTELVRLYWGIGATILQRQELEGWGTNVIGRLADDLRAEFPEMKGFSRANLFVHAPCRCRVAGRAKLSNSLLDNSRGATSRCSSTVSTTKSPGSGTPHRPSIMGGLGTSSSITSVPTPHARLEAAPSNFAATLPAGESDLAQQITKDPYVLDFLALDGDAKERQLEQALVDRIIDTLRELGEGFAFVGRQVHFDVDGDDFFVDLLFFHVEQLRYVVIELKTGKFKPEYLGQLGFYVALVDDKLRRTQHADTVGLLLVADKNDAVVRYSLGAHQTPIGVASYDLLPPAVQAALPSEADLVQALEQPDNDTSSL